MRQGKDYERQIELAKGEVLEPGRRKADRQGPFIAGNPSERVGRRKGLDVKKKERGETGAI